MSRSEGDNDVMLVDSPSIAEVHNILERRTGRRVNAFGTRPPEISVEIPVRLRLTLNELLDLADENEARAESLTSMKESGDVGMWSAATIDDLQAMAAELRATALHLLKEQWLDRSSKALSIAARNE